jgi:hypothetical protein
MKRRAKRQQDNLTIEELRQQFYADAMKKLHPNIKKNLERDGVLDDVCNGLADYDLQERRIHFMRKSTDMTRLYDYWTDTYIHVHYNGKNYRFDSK